MTVEDRDLWAADVCRLLATFSLGVAWPALPDGGGVALGVAIVLAVTAFGIRALASYRDIRSPPEAPDGILASSPSAAEHFETAAAAVRRNDGRAALRAAYVAARLVECDTPVETTLAPVCPHCDTPLPETDWNDPHWACPTPDCEFVLS